MDRTMECQWVWPVPSGAPSGRRLIRWAGIALATALILVLASGSSRAGPALAYSYLSVGSDESTNNFGVFSYAGSNCAGVCSATTALGGFTGPNVELQIDEAPFAGEGDDNAALVYYFTWTGAPNGVVNANATITAKDIVNAMGFGESQVYLAIGAANMAITTLSSVSENVFVGSPLFAETDCNGTVCSVGVANYTSPAPFGVSAPVSLQLNQVYAVEIWAFVHPTNDGPYTAEVDPTISIDEPGMITYSDGVTFDIPEPATASVLLAGVAGIGMRRRRRVLAQV